MPQWIHNRADHLMSKNPSMPKSEAFAIATQQSYASKEEPKDYGTKKGHEDAAKKYHKSSNEYKKEADPKDSSHKYKTAEIISLAFWKGFSDELVKIAETNSVAPKTFNPPKPTSLGKIKKMKTVGPNYSKPITDSPSVPAVSAVANSVKSLQPPPATFSTPGGF